MRITIKRSDLDEMIRHALSERPDEACGLIAGRDSDDGTRVIEKVYLLTKEQLQAVKDMRANSMVPLGNWHSHPETPSRPSEEDIRLANDSRASYLILSLENEDAPVLNAFCIEIKEDTKSVRKEELIIVEE